MRLCRAVLAVCVVLLTLPLHGQTPPPGQPVFRAETTLVEVSAVVVDRQGNPVLDLSAADFSIFEDGEPRELVGFRQLVSDTTSRTPGISVPGARMEVVRSNTEAPDAPVFVLLLDDLNVKNTRTHRVIRGAKGLLAQIPEQALVGVLTTSGGDGTALTLTAPGPEHVRRVEAFRGQLLRRAEVGGGTGTSRVGTPCGVGSDSNHSASCGDPTRAARRLQTVQSVAQLLSQSGSRRKVLFWVTEDMGATIIDPTEGRRAQAAALRAVLSADVAVYPVHPDELPFVKDDDPGGVLMLGGNQVAILTDELAGVTLDQMARESGGRWIVDINDHEVVLAEVVRQNSAAYMLAYDSPNARVAGRHRIDVRVNRPGVRVYSRRGYVVPDEPAVPSTAAAEPSRQATLAALLGSVVPHGQLAMRLLVTPMLADGKQGRAFATIQVDAESALGQPVDVALVTFDEHGTAANQHTLRFLPSADNDAWEAAFDLPLTRGTHQLRAAAVTADGVRSGLVVDRIEIVEPGRALWMGPPMLLGADATSDATSIHPTLARTFDAGHPLAVQVELAGRPVRDGKTVMSAQLLAADGHMVREGTAVIEPGVKHDRARATAVVPTHGLTPGSYALVLEAKGQGRDEVVRHALTVTLRAAALTHATSTASMAAEPPSDAAVVDRDTSAMPPPLPGVTPLPVAHGPTSYFDRGGTHVIRTTTEWQEFWRHLPTRQSPPDIDFARVTLLAVVLDAEAGSNATPRVDATRSDGESLVVVWRMVPGDVDARTTPAPTGHPFVVVGVSDYTGAVRFERAP